MADLSEFKQYYLLADSLIGDSSKEELGECVRVLALNVAHYQAKFGEIPLEDTLAILDAAAPNEEQAAILRDGMEIIVGLLGNVMSGLGEEKH